MIKAVDGRGRSPIPSPSAAREQQISSASCGRVQARACSQRVRSRFIAASLQSYLLNLFGPVVGAEARPDHRRALAGTAVDCFGLQNCADTNLSIDPCGDVYACATLSGDKKYSYGNINTSSLSELMSSPLAIAYRNRATDSKCSTCKWQHVCYGGCLARAHKFFGDYNRRDFYCSSLYQIYEHIETKLLSRIPEAYSRRSANRMSSVINFNRKEKQNEK